MKTLAYQMTDEQLKAGITQAAEMVEEHKLPEGVLAVAVDAADEYSAELNRRASMDMANLPEWARWMLVPMA